MADGAVHQPLIDSIQAGDAASSHPTDHAQPSQPPPHPQHNQRDGLVGMMIGMVMLLLLLLLFYIVRSQAPAPFFGNSYKLIKPPRLTANSVVTLFSPASSYTFIVDNPATYVQQFNATLKQLYGVPVRAAPHMNEILMYLAGPDADRASDVNMLLGDTNQQTALMLANRGGWGCNRIVMSLDYNAIRANPKAIVGYSDLTGLLTAVHVQTGLVTFHGPMGIDDWVDANGNETMNAFYLRRILFNNELVLFQNPPTNQTITINGGKARGRLIGGNLSVFVALVGSPYFPSSTATTSQPAPAGGIPWEERILFVEDTGEAPYRIDRMLQTLKTAGILDRVAGVIFGTCVECDPIPNDMGNSQFTIPQLLQQKVVGRPCFSNFWFGHHGEQFTLPNGILVEMDADAGTVEMLEPAMSD